MSIDAKNRWAWIVSLFTAVGAAFSFKADKESVNISLADFDEINKKGEANEAALKTANENLAASAKEVETLKGEKTTLETKVTGLEATNATLTTERDALKAERDGLKTAATNIIAECGLESTATAENVISKIKELNAMPGGKAIIVGSGKDAQLSEVQMKEAMDNLSHNKLADELFG